MITYIITKSTKGYLIREDHMMGGVANEMYAFSTVKEVQDFLPELFKEEPQEVLK